MSGHMISSMGNVTAQYKIKDIIQSLNDFKKEHIQQYKDALDVYRDDVAKKLGTLVNDHYKVRNDLINFEVPYNLGLTAPVNVEDGYDNLIAIFSKMTDDEIKLTITEASHIFSNKWDWSLAASSLNTFYSSRKAR